jgi:hypothetical protein
MARKLALVVFASALLGVVHTSSAALLLFGAHLSGPAEDPPVPSPGTGTTRVEIDTLAHTMRVVVQFQDLLFPTTVSHIHAPTALPFEGNAGVATQVPTFEGFPAGVTSGSYDNTFDLLSDATYNPAFLTANGGTAAGAEAALIAAIMEGRAYLNIHSEGFPAGEIRGFLQAIPEPSSLTLLALGAVTMGFSSLRLRKRQRMS